jgi:hypothetical protein
MFLDDLNVELIDIPEENEEESTKEWLNVKNKDNS